MIEWIVYALGLVVYFVVGWVILVFIVSSIILTITQGFKFVIGAIGITAQYFFNKRSKAYWDNAEVPESKYAGKLDGPERVCKTRTLRRE